MHRLFPSSSANGLRARSAGAPGASQAGDPGREGPEAEEEVRASGGAGPCLLPSPGLRRPAGPFLKHTAQSTEARPGGGSWADPSKEAGAGGLCRADCGGCWACAHSESPARGDAQAFLPGVRCHSASGTERRCQPEGGEHGEGEASTRRSRGAWEAAQWRDTMTLLSPPHKTPAA